MSRMKFLIIVVALLCNFAALLALAWIAFRKPHAITPPNTINIQLGRNPSANGIQLIEWSKDGATEAANIGRSECRFVQSPPGKRSFMYFAIDASFKRASLMDALVTVEYFDDAPGEFRLNYDGLLLPDNKPSQYETAGNKQVCLGTKQWQKAYFLAHDARFQNSQNGGADFRLEARVPELYVRRVTVEQLSERK